jgi:thioredoxin reductase (NADPH)
MSGYLIDRIEKARNVTVHYRTELDSVEGSDEIERVTCRNLDTGDHSVHRVSDVYVMIGATPNCGFVHGLCKVDDHGFIETDDFFRTNHPLLFAVGDVRSQSVKRVANAAGEGATCIKWLWKELTLPAQVLA